MMTATVRFATAAVIKLVSGGSDKALPLDVTNITPARFARQTIAKS